MSSLEHRIPPPLVGLVAALAMWGIARFSFRLEMHDGLRWGLVVLFLIAGIGLDLPALLAFRRAKTTVNPVKIDRVTHLVVDGPFRFTRNPMYLGMLFLLLAWAAYLNAPLALFGPLAFVLYITRFQIIPEERVMATKFGATYEVYRKRVRRWI